ncbi:MAG: hypothetical protein VX808_08910, partial [Actinomycetota bacterium]|nr:hypothetical protein [Actinomycetota bacterium]
LKQNVSWNGRFFGATVTAVIHEVERDSALVRGPMQRLASIVTQSRGDNAMAMPATSLDKEVLAQ